MSRIITISREFGSGGRELGKRLAKALGIPCYDHEIIEMIAKENGFNEDYVANVGEKSIEAAYPLTIGHRFGMQPFQIMEQPAWQWPSARSSRTSPSKATASSWAGPPMLSSRTTTR